MKEEWRPVVGFEGLYEVSNLGNVDACDKVVICKNGNKKHLRRKHMHLSTSHGYYNVTLRKEGKNKTFWVHSLVAQAFIPNPANLSEVNHKDENGYNNRIDNLEWCTHKYNCNYGTRIDRLVSKISYKVNQYDLEGNFISSFPSAHAAARYLGRNGNGAISACCLGKNKTAYGYKWKYVKEEDNNG